MRELKSRNAKGRATEKLVLELRESDDFGRAKIIDQLVSSPSREVVEQVARLLDEKNTSLRMDALDILRKTGNCYIEGIIQLLYHKNEDIRVYGCEVLSSLKHEAALPHLIEKVHEENENVKNAAVMALGEFDDPRAVKVLLEALELEEWVVFSAIYSLGKIGNKKAVPALLNLFKNREEELSLAACEALISFKESKTVDEIINFVHNLDKEKEATFIKVILDQADSRVFAKLAKKIGNALLCHLLDYIKTRKRKSLKVIDFLAHFKHEDSARAMLDILKDMDPESEEYEKVLGLFTDMREVWTDKIDRYLASEDYAYPVIRACGAIGSRIGDKVLLKVFRTSPLQTKREIMKHLGRICNGKGYKVIREAMKDADGHVQADAVAIAGLMSLHELTDDILAMAKDGYPDVRTKALLALLRLDTSLAVGAIEQFVKAGTPEDKKIYLSVTPHMDADTNLPFLKALIGDGDERVRQMAIRTVGNFIERQSYLDLFRKVLRSGDIPIEVLKIIGEKRLCAFKQVLLEIFLDPLHALWTRYHALIALGAFADHSLFPIFVKAVKDRDNLIKIGGLKALAELNDRKAIPHIRPYTKSTDEDVRTAAHIAIERLSRAQRI